jgi:glycosyltransferase involved in cell wall biosynthesis
MGIGRLHFIEAATILSALGIKIQVVQGWIPSKLFPNLVINLLGRLLGRKNLSSGLIKRRLEFLDKDSVHSIIWPELYQHIAKKFPNFLRRTEGEIANEAWRKYSKSALKYVKNSSILHIRSGAGVGGSIEIAKSYNIPIIVDHSIAHPQFLSRTLHQEYLRSNVPFSMDVNDAFWKRVGDDCKLANIVLVNSNFVKDTFVAEGFSSELIRVIYLGVDTKLFPKKTNYSIDGKLKLIFTGTFSLRKGATYILQALEILLEKKIDFIFTVIGDFSEAHLFIDKYKCKKYIDFLGHLDQSLLHTYLSEADIYIFPSLAEGCAKSGMEAMAVGLPVIATYESGLPIVDGVDGVLVSSKSANEIADAIFILENNLLLRSGIGQRASEKIREFYTWELYGKKVSSLYKELLYTGY